jgi:DNA polymerase III subunit gamma/tau
VSHLALARKYRPQRFADLVGQDPIRATLERAVATNRVAHAYLFAGPRGSGKTTTARLIAKALNCERRAEGMSEPCNECRVCAEIAAGTSMDVLEIDGASNRGIEEIRNLRENVKYAATGGKFKVYIIDEAHQLTDHAWNAFLKTLEEPPAHVRFVFATTQPLDVPETIASRCQVFEFRRLRSEELARHLLAIAAAEKVALSEGAAALIARSSEGSVRDALGRLDQALALSPEGVDEPAVARALGLAGLEAYFELGAAIAARDPKLALTALDRLHDRGMDVEEIAGGLTRHLRELLLLAVDPDLVTMVDAAPSDRERYARQAKEFRETDLSAMLTLLIETHGALRRAEAPRVLLEVCLVELCTLPSAARVERLIDRLEALEKRVGGVGRAGGSGGGASAVSSAPSPAAPEPDAPSPHSGAPDLKLVESPVAIGVPDENDPVVRWRKAVDRVKARKLLLGTCLEEGTFLGIAGTNVRVALSPEHSFHRAMLEMKENRAILNEELERSYGRGLTLQCVSAGAPGGGAAAEPAPGEPAADAEGMVKRILELFDGEILEPGPQGSGA